MTWVNDNKLPFFFPVNQRSYRHLYRHEDPFLLLFVKSFDEEEALLRAYEEVGAVIDYEILLGYCDFLEVGLCTTLAENLGIKEEDAPVLFIIEKLAS